VKNKLKKTVVKYPLLRTNNYYHCRINENIEKYKKKQKMIQLVHSSKKKQKMIHLVHSSKTVIWVVYNHY